MLAWRPQQQLQMTCFAVSHASLLQKTRQQDTMQASILLFDGLTLDAVRRIQCSATGFTCLTFTPDGAQLIAATADQSLAFFSTLTGEAQMYATAYATYTLHTPYGQTSLHLPKPGLL